MSQPFKRIRLDDDLQGVPSLPRPTYDYMISQLEEGALRYMLSSLAMTSPSVQNAISSYYDRLVLVHRTRVLDFDGYSKEAWHVLNTSSYTYGSGSKQYDSSWDAMSEVRECITAIGQQTRPESSYGTKLSALETLRKIAKTVLLAGDTLGSEVRKRCEEDGSLSDEMLRIVRLMSPEEQVRAGATSDEKGSLAEKVRWVCDEAEAHRTLGFEDLRLVLNLLLGQLGENSEEVSDGSDDE